MSNIKVAVRVRPFIKKELEHSAKCIISLTGDVISITNTKVESQSTDYPDSRDRVKHFTFDYCYNSNVDPLSPEYASQQLVYQDLGTEVLQAAFQGYNACVFAYGQTSTGKTFTMMGTQEEPGLIPRICEGLFSHVDDYEEDITYRIEVSYMEIYNERVRDLLQPVLYKHSEKYTLKVREHPKEGPYVPELSKHTVKENDEIQSLIERGNESRTTASTHMHEHSSRSHAIVTISFTQAKLEDDLPSEIISKIHLVDLAGSERADTKYSANYKGRIKEGANINKSLVTLGNVIKSLAEKALLSWDTDCMGSTQSFHSAGGGEETASQNGSPRRRSLYIPYRDSVLTWLLKDSLGGNSKTLMISTITPSSTYYRESLSTLRYAQRAKSIINKPKVNEDVHVALIRELRNEIDSLKRLLANAHFAGNIMSVQESDVYLAEKLQENETRANQLTQTWVDKWKDTTDIMQEKDLSIKGLGRRSSSFGLLIDSQLPHLIGMDDDILSTGVLLYQLKEGKTLIGRHDANREQDIKLNGPRIQSEHCFIKNVGGTVTLYPSRAAICNINGIMVKEPTKLNQGDVLLLGKVNVFRFNNPAEAAKLREHRKNVSQGSLDNLSRASSDMSIGELESLESGSSSPKSSTFMMFNPNYSAAAICLELEKKYMNEQERIEEANHELEKLREEFRNAEEQRQEKEEEMWRLHEEHQTELEANRQHLAQRIEEFQHQRQNAEDKIAAEKEKLRKEKEAYVKDLEEKLKKLVHSKREGVSKASEVTIELADVSSVKGNVEAEILKRKLSVEGQIKELAQLELVHEVGQRETQKILEEKLEDEFGPAEDEIGKYFESLKVTEEQFLDEDLCHYQEVTKQDEQLKALHKKEEQLELYIEEKQDLLKVKSDKPKPIRESCSLEILNDTEIAPSPDPSLTHKAYSVDTLSAGDISYLSPHLQTSHSGDITGSVESMESYDTERLVVSPHSFAENVSTSKKGHRNKSGKTKDSRISKTAENVTNRLYKSPSPKPELEGKYLRRKYYDPAKLSPLRVRSVSLSPTRDRSRNNGHESLFSKSSPNVNRLGVQSQQLQSTGGSDPRQSRKGHRSPNLRHKTSSSSLLASVPEAINETPDDNDFANQSMHSEPDITKAVVRRRNKKRGVEEEYKRHSAPVGDLLAAVFQQYTDSSLANKVGGRGVSPLTYPSDDIGDDDNLITPRNDEADTTQDAFFSTFQSGDDIPLSMIRSDVTLTDSVTEVSDVIGAYDNHIDSVNQERDKNRFPRKTSSRGTTTGSSPERKYRKSDLSNSPRNKSKNDSAEFVVEQRSIHGSDKTSPVRKSALLDSSKTAEFKSRTPHHSNELESSRKADRSSPTRKGSQTDSSKTLKPGSKREHKTNSEIKALKKSKVNNDMNLITSNSEGRGSDIPVTIYVPTSPSSLQYSSLTDNNELNNEINKETNIVYRPQLPHTEVNSESPAQCFVVRKLQDGRTMSLDEGQTRETSPSVMRQKDGGKFSDDSLDDADMEDSLEKPRKVIETRDQTVSTEPIVQTVQTQAVSTSTDMIRSTEDDLPSQHSSDSLADARAELQVLQEALQQLAPRLSSSSTPGSRRPSKQKPQKRHKHRNNKDAESDGDGQCSDDSFMSGNRSRSTSRPNSGSKRKKKKVPTATLR